MLRTAETTRLDQDGFIFRMGVGGYMVWHDRVIRARDVLVHVNDERWGRVRYFSAREANFEVATLGKEGALKVPDGADGFLEMLTLEGTEFDELLGRLQRLHPDSSVTVTVADPDDGSEIRRISFRDCRWEDSTVAPVTDSRKRIVTVGFRATDYTDADLLK